MNSNNGESKPINIALVGLGGLGIITLSKMVVQTHHRLNREVCMNEVHGLSQRGGTVQSFVRVNAIDCPLFFPDDTDFIIGLEKMETLRYLYTISKSKATVVVSNYYEQRNTKTLGFEVFPSIEKIDTEIQKYAKQLYEFDALGFQENFNRKFKPVNVALFTALTNISTLRLPEKEAKKTMIDLVGRNFYFRRINFKAFKEGKKWLKKRH
jgi:indolepyruvate ferredoxin oxidoreductase beta subunit